MNKSVLFLLLLFSPFFSKSAANFPSLSEKLEADQTICYRSIADAHYEFIQLRYENGEINGRAYVYINDFYGNAYYDFSLNILSDTLMEMTIQEANDQRSVELLGYHFYGQTLVFSRIIPHGEADEFEYMDCIYLPNLDDYGSLDEFESEMLAEYLENVFPIYYESVAPNALHHKKGIYESFQVLEVLDTVIGFGVGIAFDQPMWEFDFTGTIVDDSVYWMVTNYRQEGKSDTTIHEKWVYHHSNGTFQIYGHNRPETGSEFIYADDSKFIDDIRHGFMQLEERLHYLSVSPYELYYIKMGEE